VRVCANHNSKIVEIVVAAWWLIFDASWHFGHSPVRAELSTIVG
jgi:hypothetical protein